jgi:hypothetical protein
MPPVWSLPGPGVETTGTIVRVIRFQSASRRKGMTGWIFKTCCVRSSGPVCRFALYWKGTLIMPAIGFWAAFARSEASAAAASADSGRPSADDGAV